VQLTDPHAIEYAIRRSDRARRVRVTVSAAGEIEVVLPRAASERAAGAAVRELAPWIERRLSEARRARLVVTARGRSVPYLDSTLTLVTQPGRTRVHRRGGELLVPAGPDSRPALERWFRRAARAEITPRLQRACAETDCAYSKLTIRAQRTRWASCSRSGAMSFNWRLLLAPEPVLDYVVWHEVCHLEVLDHSPRFWDLLESRWPRYREHARWLREHGATLTL
jgi:predicted metal-dependent hydrolase